MLSLGKGVGFERRLGAFLGAETTDRNEIVAISSKIAQISS